MAAVKTLCVRNLPGSNDAAHRKKARCPGALGVFRYTLSLCGGGRLCPPTESSVFSGIYGGFAISQRTDVGIGPYNGARVQNTTRIRIIYTIVPPAMDKSILTATNSRLPP